MLGVNGQCGTGTTRNTNSAGSYCEQDLVNQFGVIQPEQTRFGGTVHFTANLGDAQAYRGIHAAIFDARRLCMNL